MPTVGVVVLSVPGLKHLSQCLESVKWAEEVFLFHLGGDGPPLDMSSYPLVRLRNGASLREFRDFCEGVKTDWVLHLWGEEAVGAELRAELGEVRRKELSQSPSGYRISVRSRVLGCWVEGSLLGPSPALRLRRGVGELALGWWDAKAAGGTRCPILSQGWIDDYSAADLASGVNRAQDVSRLGAEIAQAKGLTLSVARSVFYPLQVFTRICLKDGLFSTGLPGLTLSILAAYATLLTGAKVWEARNVRSATK